jgi:Gamma interferon inducible lysosomal thiol reductase (GILT)
MSFSYCLCLLCVLVLLFGSVKTESVKSPGLNISIYYESHCKYSRKFFQQQLRPIYSKIRSHVNLRFVPFGVAEVRKLQAIKPRCRFNQRFLNIFPQSFLTPSGKIEFKCQHGVQEVITQDSEI